MATDDYTPKGKGPTCPVCDARYKLRARCQAANSTCANGHNWFYCLECCERVVGRSHDAAAKGGLCAKCQAEGWEVEGHD